MWYPFFMVGGLYFWMLTCVWLALLTLWVDGEQVVPSFFSVVLYVGLITVLGDANIFGFIVNRPYALVSYVLIYLGVGVLWSMGKLYFSVRAVGVKVRNIKLRNNGKSPEEIERIVKMELSHEERDRAEFKECSGDIIFWMCYWPVSAFWTILNDPIKEFFIYVYENLLQGVFKKIHTKAMSDSKGGQ